MGKRSAPRYPDDGGGGGGGGGICCVLCWCCCFLFLIVAALAGAAAYALFLYKPKAPSYSVSNMSVSQFDFNSNDLTLYTKLVATVRAENPNEMIGIIYGDGSRTVVSYRGTPLCSGHLPTFYQGFKNVTVMEISMEGRHGFGSGLQSALEESEKEGNVPLDVFVSVPVSLRFGSFDVREVRVNVHCALVVDSISPKKKPTIKSATYQGNVEF
uniref:Late embryogenesis abundant protein LEA-2 subgroup domain-containing protein n=1 Tax=Oryza rufipogon TaxID=4529 RepID=A0A0E0QNU4_ORYRU